MTGTYHGLLIRRIVNRLYYGDSVMFADPRRDEMAHATNDVLRVLNQSGCYTVRVDMSHLASVDELARLIMSQVSVLGGVAVPVPATANQIDPFVAVEDALDAMEGVARRGDKRLVCVMEEFGDAERIGGDPLWNAMRTMMQRHEYAVYLFTGSDVDLMRSIFADYQRALYSFATILHLP